MEKLKHGDYVTGLTEEQYSELLTIERYGPNYHYSAACVHDDGICYQEGTLLNGLYAKVMCDIIAGHDFENFKQKCINTFGK